MRCIPTSYFQVTEFLSYEKRVGMHLVCIQIEGGLGSDEPTCTPTPHGDVTANMYMNV